MAPASKNRRCDHVIARAPHCDAGVSHMVEQGIVADESEATAELPVLAPVATHGDLLGYDKDSRAGLHLQLEEVAHWCGQQSIDEGRQSTSASQTSDPSAKSASPIEPQAHAPQ